MSYVGNTGNKHWKGWVVSFHSHGVLGAVETRSDQLKKQRALVSKAQSLLLP